MPGAGLQMLAIFDEKHNIPGSQDQEHVLDGIPLSLVLGFRY